LVILLAPIPQDRSEPTDRTIRVEASSFEYSPAIISVRPGDRLTIELVATDVVHGLYIDGYEKSITADPGQTTRLTLVADREGTFRIRCSVSCGPLHPFMIGKLQVGTNWLLWRMVGVALLVAVAVVMGPRR
jgi:plastocyanin